MKGSMKRRFLKTLLAGCLAFGLTAAPCLTARASNIIAVVRGTVLAETTANLLYLSTKDGVMEIKLDANTDVGDCKVLFPDKQISVSLSSGSDGYLHAAKLSNEPVAAEATVDTSSTVTVYGVVDKRSRDDMLYLNTSSGTMEIKLDASTDISKCRLLVAGDSYTVACARGSDAYMHAVRIEGGDTPLTAASTGLTPAPSNPGSVPAATLAAVGTVTANTKPNLLYLNTSGGEMQFVIDANTDTRNGMMLIPGNTLVVSGYRGNDAYLHASMVIGIKGVPNAVIDTANTTAVTGTVNSKSTEDMLFLDTSNGTMELKLDGVSSVVGCKVLVSGQRITVECARGSDAYMHAVKITA